MPGAGFRDTAIPPTRSALRALSASLARATGFAAGAGGTASASTSAGVTAATASVRGRNLSFPILMPSWRYVATQQAEDSPAVGRCLQRSAGRPARLHSLHEPE